MAINKVEANGETLIDLTSDTVTADTLVSGRTAHLASGAQVTGTFEPVTGVKGNAESAYRKGNVNLTPANIGAATSEQGAKADSAVQTIQIGGNAQAKTNGTVNLPAYPTKSSLGLGNVGNFKAVSTVSSQGLTDTEKANARTNIGAGTSSFDGNYNSLSNKPTIPAAVAVKGNAETSYRTGNVNITPANLGLGNVNNTSDADKPISTAAQAAFDNQQAQIDKALEQTGYNLLEITADTQTINGVTFTVDKAAGTITANGTATALIAIPVSKQLSNILEVGKSYYMTGCPSGGSFSSKYALYVALDGSTVWRDEGGGEKYSVPQSGTLSTLHLIIRSGVTVSNIVFKPMIVPTELAGVPFQPYAMSNADLTQKALIPQGDYNTVSVDGGLNFETTDQTTLEVTEGDIVLISNGKKSSCGLTIEVNERNEEYGNYYFRHNGLTASYVIDGHDSHYELIPKVDSNHNGIFRGDDLTLAWVENGKIKEALYTKVHSGDFSGLYLGDYFTVSITTDIYTKFTGSSFVSGTTYYTLGGSYPNWDYTATTDTEPTGGKIYFTKQTVTENVDLMIAAFDYYYNVGDTALTSHHLVFIPRNYGFKTTAKMNPTNTTMGSYFNSDMHQFTLPCYAKSLKTVLNNHLLAHRTILPYAINAGTPSMAGAGMTGASNAWVWETVELQLMSEPQIYGTTVWSSSAYDVGVDYKKLPVFDFINGVQHGRLTYWLRSVVSSTHFANCGYHGAASADGAFGALCVRPLILFG